MKRISSILLASMVLSSGALADVVPFEGRVLLASEPLAIPGARIVLYDLERPESRISTTTAADGSFSLAWSELVRPESDVLGQNYPNPFNPSTLIPFQLSEAGPVRLDVFNMLGQRLVTLMDGEQPAGLHQAQWDGTDGAGRAVGAGVYIYRLTTREGRQTRRLVLVDGQAGRPGRGAGSSGGAESPRYGVEISGQDIVTSTWVWSPEMGSLVAQVEGARPASPTELDMPQVGPNPFSGIDLDSVIQVITAL